MAEVTVNRWFPGGRCAVRHVKILAALVLMAGLGVSVPVPGQAASAIQSLESIRAVAREFALENLVTEPARSSIEIGNLDSRLRLRRCNAPIEAFSNKGANRGGRSTIGVRCSGSSPWTIYVSAQVNSYVDVYTLARSMGRGERIRAQDLVAKEANVGLLAYGYYTDADKLVGMELRRTGRPGEILTPNLVAPPELVKRGEVVTVQAQAGSAQVSMQGTAMDSGALGDRIRVRNSSSNRIIEGDIIGISRVRIPM